MTLDSLAKYYSPKSTLASSGGRATASDGLTITDVMAAIGMASAKAATGIELYLSKVGVLSPGPSIEYLYHFAKEACHNHPALQKLPSLQRWSILRLLAEYAYKDYSRSAASTEECECCSGTGFIEQKKFVMNRKAVKHDMAEVSKRGDLPASITPVANREMYSKHVYYDIDRKKCAACDGKGKVKIACRCHGSGKVRDLETSERLGKPVDKKCCKCSGRGYPRLMESEVYNVLCIPKTTWQRNFRPFFEMLVDHCYAEEAHAEEILKVITE